MNWKAVKGYEGIYEVSDQGEVKSLSRDVKYGFGNCGSVSEIIMKQKNEKNGYRRIKLCNGGKWKYYCVHRLVSEAFLPNPELKKTVNHKDGNRSNNILSNLEWATNSENQLHSFRRGRVSIGVKKLNSVQKIHVLYLLNSGLTQSQVANHFKVSQPTISNIKKELQCQIL